MNVQMPFCTMTARWDSALNKCFQQLQPAYSKQPSLRQLVQQLHQQLDKQNYCIDSRHYGISKPFVQAYAERNLSQISGCPQLPSDTQMADGKQSEVQFYFEPVAALSQPPCIVICDLWPRHPNAARPHWCGQC